jgi:translation initiation factor 4E
MDAPLKVGGPFTFRNSPPPAVSAPSQSSGANSITEMAYSKLSLSVSNAENDSPQSRNYNSSKRLGGESGSSHVKHPFSAVAPLTTNNISSPTPSGASSAFGLGSGAFASFGSSAKTPKSPGNALDFGNSTVPGTSPSPVGDKREKEGSRNVTTKTSSSSLSNSISSTPSEHPLKHTWVVWYRPPTSKYSDYEKSTLPLVSFSSVESFWTIYSHLKRPSSLPSVSDYHIFKKGVRPVWEDKENRKGGKWIVRLRKGVADRYWEDLLLAIVGDQFAEAGEEVCGAVLSVRSGEDVLSVWTRIDGGRNIKIR